MKHGGREETANAVVVFFRPIGGGIIEARRHSGGHVANGVFFRPIGGGIIEARTWRWRRWCRWWQFFRPIGGGIIEAITRKR